MSIELMLNAVNLTFVAFAHMWHQVSGQIFVFFVMVVAAAEAAVGLAIIIAIFRTRQTLNVDQIDLMKLVSLACPLTYLWLIPLLPFAGFLINGTARPQAAARRSSPLSRCIFTAIPAAIVAWLWIIMKSAGAPEAIHSRRPALDRRSPASRSTSPSPSTTSR